MVVIAMLILVIVLICVNSGNGCRGYSCYLCSNNNDFNEL